MTIALTQKKHNRSVNGIGWQVESWSKDGWAGCSPIQRTRAEAEYLHSLYVHADPSVEYRVYEALAYDSYGIGRNEKIKREQTLLDQLKAAA